MTYNNEVYYAEDPAVLNVKFSDGKFAFGIMKEWFECYS